MANDSEDLSPSLSPESKVGLFVLAGLAVVVASILVLGDIQFRPQTHINILFRSVEGITDKSPVKVSGVEIGTVKDVSLEDDHARLNIAIRKDIRVYRNARARIRSTGIIGSKFLAFDPGKPDPGIPEESQRLKNGETILGEDSVALDEMLEHVGKSIDQLTGNGKLGENLNATMANLRNITDSLNAAVGQQRRSMVNIVKNIEGFSVYAKSVAEHLDEVLVDNRKDLQVAMHNIRETFERLNDVLARIQRGEGAVGTLLADKQVGQELKQTVTNLKQTSESAKEVLARFTKVRAFWEITARRDFTAGVYHGDVGLRLEPRPDKFYYVAGQNLGSDTTTKPSSKDYERRNTLTALLGKHWGPITGAVGFIKSRGGVEGRYRPFQDTEIPVLNQTELIAQAFDFGRNDFIKGKKFDEPNYTAGGRVHVNKFVTVGLQGEDLAETKNVNGVVNVAFEDKDIAYLLGFVSFAR